MARDLRYNRAQSLVEYIIIIGVVVTAVYIMAPAFKRGTQSVIKVTADQLGAQPEAEQDFSADASHMENSVSSLGTKNSRTVSDSAAGLTTVVNEMSQSFTSTMTNGGTN